MKRYSQNSTRVVFTEAALCVVHPNTINKTTSLPQRDVPRRQVEAAPTTTMASATLHYSTSGSNDVATMLTNYTPLHTNTLHQQHQLRMFMTSPTTPYHHHANPRGRGSLTNAALQKMLQLLYNCNKNGEISSPIDWGSRRPTEYPEWVTLEVAHGGFATGRAMASFELDEARRDVDGNTTTTSPPRTNISYLNSKEGLEELLTLLDSGNYVVDYPENGALLVLVHLLRQDKLQEVKELLQTIAPYFNEIRFYPVVVAINNNPNSSKTATSTSGEEGQQKHNDDKEANLLSIPLKFGLVTLEETIRKLSRLDNNVGINCHLIVAKEGKKMPPSSPLCSRFTRMKYQRDGCDVYEPIQSEAVQLLLQTSKRSTPTKKNSPSSTAKKRTSTPWHELPPQEADALLLTNTNDVDLNLRIRTLISRYCAVNPQPSSIVTKAAFPDIVPTPTYVGAHVKQNTSTRVLIEALCLMINPPPPHPNQSDPKLLSATPPHIIIPTTKLSHIGNRLRDVIRKRGIAGTPKHDDIYRKQLERSSNVMDHLEVFAKATITVLVQKQQQQQQGGGGGNCGDTYLEEDENEAVVSGTPHSGPLHTKIIETAIEVSNTRETSIAAKERKECEEEVPLTLSTKNAVRYKLFPAAFKHRRETETKTYRIRSPRQYYNPGTVTVSNTVVPAQIRRSLSVATSRTLSGHIQAKTIVSAEMIADAVPKIFNAAASNSITNPTLRRLYFNITNAFSRRRSLLLLNLQHQVRIEELPWMKTLLQEQQECEKKTASLSDIDSLSNPTKSTSCDPPPALVETMKEASLTWFETFPQTPITNKFISSMKNVSRTANTTSQNSKIPVLIEELAADIFEGEFSPSFYMSTLEAARCMQGTVYERYYNLGSVYKDLLQIEQQSQIAKPDPELEDDHTNARNKRNQEDRSKKSDVLISAARNAMTLWGVAASKGGAAVVSKYSYKENSQLTESVMVMSTHNTAQLYSWLGGCSGSVEVGSVKNMVTARKIWGDILRVFSAPPPHQRRGERAISNAWRQLLFFLSMEEIRIKKLHQKQPYEAAVEFQNKIVDFCVEMEKMLLVRSTPERKEGMPLDAKNTLLVRNKFIHSLRRCASEPNQQPTVSSSQSPLALPPRTKLKELGENARTTGSEDTTTDGWGAKHGDVILTYFGWKMFNPKKRE